MREKLQAVIEKLHALEAALADAAHENARAGGFISISVSLGNLELNLRDVRLRLAQTVSLIQTASK